MSHITIPTNSSALYQYIDEYLVPLNDASNEQLFNNVKVFINGSWQGVTLNPEELCNL